MKHVISEIASLTDKYILKATLILFSVIAFLYAVSNDEGINAQELCFAIFGGVRCGTNYSDISRAAIWLLTQIPLLSLLGVYFSSDFSSRIFFAVVRSQSAIKWWNCRFISTVIFSAAYAMCSFVLVFFIGTLFGSQQKIIDNISLLFAILCMYTLGCIFLSVFMLTLTVWLCDLKKTLIYVTVSLTVCIEFGWIFPASNPYLIFTLSMLKRSRLIDAEYGFSLWHAALFMTLLCTVLFFIGRYVCGKFLTKLQKNDFGGC